MRVMFDTNVLISAIFFPTKRLTEMFDKTVLSHTIVLSSYVIDELLDVAERKFPDKKSAVEEFLSRVSYEYVYVPKKLKGGLFDIRDAKDYPVLYAAVIEDVDIFITGDKDFMDVAMERPEILTPAEYIGKYM